MQALPQPQLPAPPAQPTAPATITVPGADGKTLAIAIPKSTAEVKQLLMQRREIGVQLDNVTSRRFNLAREIRNTADPGTRAGLEQRLRVLDDRLLQLETDAAATGRQLAVAPADMTLAAQRQIGTGRDSNFGGGMAAGVFLSLIAVTVINFIRRRRRRRKVGGAPATPAVEASRLERIEQGMEAIAIEVERVSEGQRFVTKLLAESQPRERQIS